MQSKFPFLVLHDNFVSRENSGNRRLKAISTGEVEGSTLDAVRHVHSMTQRFPPESPVRCIWLKEQKHHWTGGRTGDDLLCLEPRSSELMLDRGCLGGPGFAHAVCRPQGASPSSCGLRTCLSGGCSLCRRDTKSSSNPPLGVTKIPHFSRTLIRNRALYMDMSVSQLLSRNGFPLNCFHQLLEVEGVRFPWGAWTEKEVDPWKTNQFS